MRMIVTADDYGISDAVTEGILTCARRGCLTQTGLFTNMPGSEYAAKRMIKEFPHISLGQDINLVAYKPVTDYKLIPTLVDEDGYFIKSSRHRFLDKTDPHHMSYEDAYLETENQVKKFIEFTGRKPDYLGGHAYICDATMRSIQDVAKKYGIPVVHDLFRELNVVQKDTPWNALQERPDGTWGFGMEEQSKIHPLQSFINGEVTFLQEALEKDQTVDLHTHAGFVDEDLIRRSSFTLIREKEADLLCSQELLSWIEENHVELVSLKDLANR